MRIHVLSDLHLEVRPYEAAQVEADVVVLAGDIANGAPAIEWAARSFTQPVLFVSGNHEAWEDELGRATSDIAAAARGTNVRVLDCGSAVISGVRFLGCTLWTDFSLESEATRPDVIERSRRYNPDHEMIRLGARWFTPEDSIRLHREQLAWLQGQLAEPHTGSTVAITHFAPHPRSIAAQFDKHPANPGFVLDLDRMMGKDSGGPALWIHGHTHTAFDYDVRGTRVVCNPRGYPEEQTGFDPGFTVTL
jgi:predicted phosphodiesterase